jgi:hypothetical protein
MNLKCLATTSSPFWLTKNTVEAILKNFNFYPNTRSDAAPFSEVFVCVKKTAESFQFAGERKYGRKQLSQHPETIKPPSH